MKKTTIILAVLFSHFLIAQTTIRKTLYKGEFEIEQKITEQDTMTYFYYGFQNARYSRIIDIGVIFLTNKEDVKLFAEKILEFSKIPKDEKVDFAHKEFNISATNSYNLLVIRDKDSAKFTYLNKGKKTVKLANDILANLHLLKD